MNKGLSFETLVAIRDCVGLNVQERCCLMMIYSRGNKHTASMTTLAANMGYTHDRQARRVVGTLRDKGVLSVVEHSGGTHTIKINLPALKTLVPQDKGTPVLQDKGTPVLQDKGKKPTPAPQDKGGMSSKTRGGGLTRLPKEKDKENLKENLGQAAGASQELGPSLIPSKEQGLADGVGNKELPESAALPSGEPATPVLQDEGTPAECNPCTPEEQELLDQIAEFEAILPTATGTHRTSVRVSINNLERKFAALQNAGGEDDEWL